MDYLIFDRFFYHPTKTIFDHPSRLGLAPEDVYFSTVDGVRLHGWFFKGQGRVRGTVLHLHGNSGNITGHFPYVAWLPAIGWNLLCIDYRGYGQSQGRICRSGTIRDGHGGVDYLRQRPDVDPEKIVLFGQSLGGAVAVVLAAERSDIRGLAVDGAFGHYRRIANWHIRQSPFLWPFYGWAPAMFMSNDHHPIDHVKRIGCPLLVMHGQNDRIVPVDMGENLFRQADRPKTLWLVPGEDHYGPLLNHAEQAQARIAQFFERCLNDHVLTDVTENTSVTDLW